MFADDIPLYCKVRVEKPLTDRHKCLAGDTGTFVGKAFRRSALYLIHIPGRGHPFPMWREEFEVIDDD